MAISWPCRGDQGGHTRGSSLSPLLRLRVRTCRQTGPPPQEGTGEIKPQSSQLLPDTGTHTPWGGDCEKGERENMRSFVPHGGHPCVWEPGSQEPSLGKGQRVSKVNIYCGYTMRRLPLKKRKKERKSAARITIVWVQA